MTGRRRRALPLVAGLAVSLVMALGPVPVAGAAAGLSVDIATPEPGEWFTSSGRVTVTGEASAATLFASVGRVSVRFYRGGGMVESGDACNPCSSDPTVPFSYTSGVLDHNGPYTVEVVAVGHVLLSGLRVDGSATRDIVVAVPPAPPTGLKAEPQPDRTVKLSWTAPAMSPDFLGYAIYRNSDSRGFVGLHTTVNTTFTDQGAAQLGGAVQYQVASVRRGPVPDDPREALQTRSAAVVANLPALPTTTTSSVPGGTSAPPTTAVPGGGLQDGGAAELDLGSLLQQSPVDVPRLPAPTPPTLPDTGFDANLPFPSTSAPASSPIEGRQQGRAASSTGTGELGAEGGDDSNRRALLVPVAAGSVLCVTALHLRWLNRRLATGAAAVVTGGGAAAGGPGPFDIAELEPLGPEPEHVGAGSGASGRLR
ncbi:MAG: fibronectin type III domain-containing protein [Actinomycetota bacterium]